MKYEVFVQNGSQVFEPAALDAIEWSTERKGSPGKLSFSVVSDATLNIQEGNAVQFNVDGQKIFYGYIFKKTRDKSNEIKVTCYDQLRYFKNKDTYIYSGKKASEVLQMVCSDFYLNTGVIEDTEYVIPQKIESNKTLFDIVQNALDDTLMNSRQLFCLYDDYGKITLKNIGNLKIGLLIDETTGQNFEYTSSIDSQTYNVIKLIYENEKGGKTEIHMEHDLDHVDEWGVLQFFDTLKEGENGKNKAKTLLDYYNRESRNIKISDALGDIRVRAGTAPIIRLNIGDMKVNNFMVCDKVSHRFKNNEHRMDLTLLGGDFIA